jgi:hypothetical protein
VLFGIEQGMVRRVAPIWSLPDLGVRHGNERVMNRI